MSTLTTSLLVPPPNDKLKQPSVSAHRRSKRVATNTPNVTVSRLFGSSIFEASKLKVMFLGVDEKKHPASIPRTYTLTHSDITSQLTLAISQSINMSQLQGWYNKLQRDEVVAEWKKVKGEMSLHVHCHISGDHLLHDLCAKLRYFIFYKELPIVLRAFVHGDGNLLNNYPELQEALVWVYFHSNFPEYNKIECWGPLKDAAAPNQTDHHHRHHYHHHNSYGQNPINKDGNIHLTRLHNNASPEEPCMVDCTCCFPISSSPQEF